MAKYALSVSCCIVVVDKVEMAADIMFATIHKRRPCPRA
jgi:hypothetical protein